MPEYRQPIRWNRSEFRKTTIKATRRRHITKKNNYKKNICNGSNKIHKRCIKKMNFDVSEINNNGLVQMVLQRQTKSIQWVDSVVPINRIGASSEHMMLSKTIQLQQSTVNEDRMQSMYRPSSSKINKLIDRHITITASTRGY